MEQIGFTDVELYGSLDGDEYSPNAYRLIAVAQRAKEPIANKHRTKELGRHGQSHA